MKKIMLGILVWLNVSVAYGCTAVAIPKSKSKLMGKNFVWSASYGRLALNRAHMRKRALVPAGSQPMTWVAKYPSFTFNQIAENFPYGGMNSEGLGVEILLARAEYPKSTEKPVVNESQWIQYLLDTAANVKEAIAQAKKVDILPLGRHSVHYFACDKNGDCAVFEYVDGKLVISDEESEGENPVGVTNAVYASLVEQGVREPVALPGIVQIGERSAEIRRLVDEFLPQDFKSPREEVAKMASVLQNIGSANAWQIVYELANRKLHFRVRPIEDKSFWSIGLKDFATPDSLDCRRAIETDPKTRRRYVRSSRRLNWDNMENAELKAVDFVEGEGKSKLWEQSRFFLRAAEVGDWAIDQLATYPATHTACLLDK